jgi:hypothetical protein
MTLTSEQAQQGAAALVLGVGVGDALAPRLTGGFFGLDTDAAPLVPWLLRLYGISLVSLGTQVQLAEGGGRKTALEVLAVTSGATGVASLLARARGQVSTRSAVMTAAAAGAVCALAVTALSEA